MFPLTPVGAQSVQEQSWSSQVGLAVDAESKGSQVGMMFYEAYPLVASFLTNESYSR